MGAAPSREILRTAPFRTPHGGARQIALIPFTREFFPSADCPLFQQLYEARMDPSVRYYMRNERSDMRQDRIPPVMYTCDELYEMYASTAIGVPIYETNAEVAATVASGKEDQVRPVPCAVVFLYEGATHVPEGSIRLTRDRDVYVKVIGGIGDASAVFRMSTLRKGYYHVQMFITKSAGDHNMGRVALLATYVYRHQCVDLIGLAEPPLTPVLFLNLKTNIPFLCFLRELRDRTSEELVPPDVPPMWLEDDCIRGSITREFAKNMCAAFADHFLAFAEAKANQRAAKQIRRLGNHNHGMLANSGGAHRNNNSSNVSGGVAQQSCTAISDDLLGASGAEKAGLSDDTAEASKQMLPDPNITMAATKDMNATGGSGSGSGQGANKRKVTYTVMGYITAPDATIVAESHDPNEVYVACCDAVVRILEPVPGKAPNTLLKGISMKPKVSARVTRKRAAMAAAAEKGTSVSEEELHRIDAEEDAKEEVELSAHVAASSSVSLSPTDAAAMAVAEEEDGVMKVLHVRRGEILSYQNPPRTDGEDGGGGTPIAAATADPNGKLQTNTAGKEEANTSEEGVMPVPGGCWRVDTNVYIENVLLSLVRDECRNAREADVDDPRWMRDEEKNCPVHDDSFYIWRFRRGLEVFYYGTVPKFANPNKRRSGNSKDNSTNNNRASVHGAGRSGHTHPNHSGTSPGRNPNGSGSHRRVALDSLSGYPGGSGTTPIAFLGGGGPSNSSPNTMGLGASGTSVSYDSGSGAPGGGAGMPTVLLPNGTATVTYPPGGSSGTNRGQRGGWSFPPASQQPLQGAHPPPPPYNPIPNQANISGNPQSGLFPRVQGPYGPGDGLAQSPPSQGMPSILGVNYGGPVNPTNTHPLQAGTAGGYNLNTSGGSNNTSPFPSGSGQAGSGTGTPTHGPRQVIIMGPNGQPQAVPWMGSPSVPSALPPQPTAKPLYNYPSPQDASQLPPSSQTSYVLINGQVVGVPQSLLQAAMQLQQQQQEQRHQQQQRQQQEQQQQQNQALQQQLLIQALLQSMYNHGSPNHSGGSNNPGNSPQTSATVLGPNGPSFLTGHDGATGAGTIHNGGNYGSANNALPQHLLASLLGGTQQTQQPSQQPQQPQQPQLTLQQQLLALQEHIQQQQQRQQQQNLFSVSNASNNSTHALRFNQGRGADGGGAVNASSYNVSGSAAGTGGADSSSMNPQIAAWIQQQQQLFSGNAPW